MLPFVCRRWAVAVNSPQLLRSIGLTMHFSATALLPRLRSLSEWLLIRAAPHVQELRLDLLGSIEDDSTVEASTALAAALAACGASGLLSNLYLKVCWPLAASSWLAPLRRSLRHLDISTEDGPLPVTGSLAALTCLQDLKLG